MMDVAKGLVVYVLALLQSNDNLTAIPWEMIADKEKGGYKISLSEQEHQKAPRIDRERLSTIVDDKAFLDKVFDTFSSKKYWDPPPSKSQGESPKGKI